MPVQPQNLTREDLIKLEAERFQKLIEHWCPENLHYEGYPNTLVRAFMHITACCADQKRKLDGLDPIRELDSYPDPLVGFANTPTGFNDSSYLYLRRNDNSCAFNREGELITQTGTDDGLEYLLKLKGYKRRMDKNTEEWVEVMSKIKLV